MYRINLVALAKEFGVANIRIRIPMRPVEMAGIIPGMAFKSSRTAPVPTICKINEARYTVSDGYKITLEHDTECPDNGKLHCGCDHFYICDLESLIDRAPEDFQVFTVSIDGFHRVEEFNP